MPKAKPMTVTQIRRALSALPGWTFSRGAIRRKYDFKTFLDGIRFVVAVADLAEAMDHHPDLDIRYRTIRVALSTHDAGGITDKDFALAGRIESRAIGEQPI